MRGVAADIICRHQPVGPNLPLDAEIPSDQVRRRKMIRQSGVIGEGRKRPEGRGKWISGWQRRPGIVQTAQPATVTLRHRRRGEVEEGCVLNLVVAVVRAGVGVAQPPRSSYGSLAVPFGIESDTEARRKLFPIVVAALQ